MPVELTRFGFGLKVTLAGRPIKNGGRNTWNKKGWRQSVKNRIKQNPRQSLNPYYSHYRCVLVVVVRLLLATPFSFLFLAGVKFRFYLFFIRGWSRIIYQLISV